LQETNDNLLGVASLDFSTKFLELDLGKLIQDLTIFLVKNKAARGWLKFKTEYLGPFKKFEKSNF
jgi:hypothetical protein